MDLPTFLIQCLNSLQYGLLLFLVASGLTLIFGIMGVINLAHGSFYMIGAYMAYALAAPVATPTSWLPRSRPTNSSSPISPRTTARSGSTVRSSSPRRIPSTPAYS